MDAGISRNVLSKDICSEKYLYLIERGDRSPSAEIIRLLSYRLGTDLFNYYEYLDCTDPLTVYHAIKDFNICRRLSDFKELKKQNDNMKLHPDFLETPWKYEIDVNNALNSFFLERKPQETIDYIESLLNDIDEKFKEEEFTANLYVILSRCYQRLGRINEARSALYSARKIISSKMNIARYYQVIITVKLITMTFANLTEDYDLAIEEGLSIHQLQLKTNIYDRSSYMFYYIAYAYYKKGMEAEAVEWFEKCLFDLLIHYNPIPVHIISKDDLFYELFFHQEISPSLRTRIKNIYNRFL